MTLRWYYGGNHHETAVSHLPNERLDSEAGPASGRNANAVLEHKVSLDADLLMADGRSTPRPVLVPGLCAFSDRRARNP